MLLPQRFSVGPSVLAGLLSLLGSLLAPAALRIQPYPGLFPGPAAPGFGLPFLDPLWPLTGAFLAGLILGLLVRQVSGPLAALGYCTTVLVWGMLWGGGLTERGLVAAGLIGLLAAVCVASAEAPVKESRGVRLLFVLLPHGLCLLFLLRQTGLTNPLGGMIAIGLLHGVLSVRGERGARIRPLLVALFVLQSALLVLGAALLPLLPGR